MIKHAVWQYGVTIPEKCVQNIEVKFKIPSALAHSVYFEKNDFKVFQGKHMLQETSVSLATSRDNQIPCKLEYIATEVTDQQLQIVTSPIEVVKFELMKTFKLQAIKIYAS